ncbi:hypothetical protein MBLNU457_g2628t1 [Dothideomycetes sp. NU457]
MDAWEERMIQAHCPWDGGVPVCQQPQCRGGECLKHPEIGDEDVQRLIPEHRSITDEHEFRLEEWRDLVNKEFDEFRKLPQTYFGLDAVASLLRLENYSPSFYTGLPALNMNEHQTEIVWSCLTLPSKTGKSSTEILRRYDYEEDEPDRLDLKSVVPYMVDTASLVLTDDHKKRFGRAMRFLALKPSLHPSQLVREI